MRVLTQPCMKMIPHEPLQRPLELLDSDPISGIAAFEQILLSNSGEDAFDAALKLLSAKLAAEHESSDLTVTQFRLHETPEKTYEVVQALYKKALARWPELGSGKDDLEITPAHLVRALRPLIGWRLSGSDLSWLDATLERLLSRDAKGSLGQYFTPREVIRLCVNILNPSASDLVIDPACGSGGFLFEAVQHAQRTSGEVPQCLGVDLSSKSIRVAALLAAALSDSTIHVSKSNSLDGRGLEAFCPAEWSPFLVEGVGSSTRRATSWGAWNRLGCDVLLTNPPFAGDLDEPDLLDAYESQQASGGKRTVSREHLFLERAVNMLKPGGRLAIVLPQGILANTSAAYLRSWVLSKCKVVAVVGLHPFAFLPYTAVKTSILIVEKPLSARQLSEDYQVLFTVSKNPGKDSSGRKVSDSDYREIENAICGFAASVGYEWALPAADCTSTVAEYELVSVREIRESLRLDAEHYDPEARRLERSLRERGQCTVSDVVSAKVGRFRRKDFREVQYADISCVDGRTGLLFPEAVQAADAPSRASYLLEPGDVLVSNVRPERNVVALVTEPSESNIPLIASNGFTVLRSDGIPPELLFAFCKSDAFKRVLTMHATASMYPTVGDRDILNLPFVRFEANVEDEVVALVREGLQKIREAQESIRQAIDRINVELS